MTLQRWFHPTPLLFLALWLVLMAKGPARLFRDPGTFWHTRVGQLLWQEGFFRHDPFTFTFAGQPWIPHQWLGELLLAGLYRLGGFDLQLWFTAVLLAGLFAWFGHRLMQQAGWHPLLAIAAIAIALAAAGTHFHVRPHLMTIAGMGIVAQLIADVETGRAPLRRLLWLTPLLAVWANIHGGALGGWASLLLVAAGWFLWWWLGRPAPVRCGQDAALLGGILAAVVLLTGANPYGFDLFRAWHSILDETILRQIIEEHRPLSWHDPSAWPTFFLIVVYAVLLAGLPRSAWRITWLLPSLWAVQAVERCRHAALFVVVLLPVLAAAWPATRWAPWCRRRRPDWFCDASSIPACPPTAWLLPAAVVLLSLVLQLLQLPLPPLGSHGTIPSAAEWPLGLLPLMHSEAPPSQQPARLFNDYRDGGFVIFFAPAYRVFVDDRCELFGGPWLQQFVLAASDPDAAARAIADWDRLYGPFDYALVRHQTPFARYFAAHPHHWQELGRDTVAVFYRRRPVSSTATTP